MTVNRHIEAQLFEKLHMYRQRHQPLLTSHYMCGPHEVIVYDVCKVISRYPCSLEDDYILIVFRHGKFTSDGVLHLYIPYLLRRQIVVSCRAESYDIRLSCIYVGLDLIVGKIPALLSILAVYTCSLLCLFLSLSYCCKLVLCEKARISHAFGNQFLCKALVYLASLALVVRAVIAFFSIQQRTLVKIYAEESQRRDYSLYSPLYISLVIGVFYPEIERASRLMRQPFVNESSIEVPQMYESCRTRAKPCDHSAFGHLTLREKLLVILRFLVYMRKQQLRQFIVVHIDLPLS